MVFEDLDGKLPEVMFDEWDFGKWMDLGIFDVFNLTQIVTIDKSKYYKFMAELGRDNQFNIQNRLCVYVHISKACFDRELIRHGKIDSWKDSKCDLVMSIKRKDKYHIQIRYLERIEHKNVGDDILHYLRREESMI